MSIFPLKIVFKTEKTAYTKHGICCMLRENCLNDLPDKTDPVMAFTTVRCACSCLTTVNIPHGASVAHRGYRTWGCR